MPPSHQYRERDYEFANTFVTLRITIELTQQSLATRLGVSRRAVENWEQGLTTPQAKHLKTFLELCVHFSAFAAGHEEEQIRAFWKAARQKVLLDEYWLTDLLSPPSPSPTAGTGKPSPDSKQASAPPAQEVALWTVPYTRNPHFTGRDELLSELEHKLAPRATDQPSTIHQAALTQSQAIKGLGGIGKTQTAIEYAYRAREQGRYTHTLWISAASEEAVLASFAALKDRVPELGNEEASDQRALVNKALRWLEQRPDPWLLIYDNADEISFLPPYLPKEGRGSILFTTRASAVSTLAPSLDVDTLPLEEGVLLLLRRAGREDDVTAQEREEARTLVLALGQFPLAIDQAGAYLEETQCTLADYLHIYEQHQYELLARRGKQVTGYPDAVATTWSLAFEKVEERNPAAAELLQLCAFVAPDQIPEELLIEGAPHWPATLQEAVTDRFHFNQMLSTLLAYSLIKRVGRERLLSMHRLVQAVQMARLTPQEQRQWTEGLVLAVQAIFPRDPEEVASWSACQRYLEQALACDALLEQHHLQLPEAADMLNRTGIYLRERGLYRTTEPLLQRALSMREQLLGPEHIDVATSLQHLATLSWKLKEYAQAETLQLRVLRIREQHQGTTHPDFAEALNDLALIYYEQGNYAQVETLLLRALAILEQQFGPEHPQVAYSLNNLANFYYDQGNYTQAETLYLRTIRILEHLRGPEHPKVATALYNLAHLYFKLRKYEQSEPLFQQALLIDEQHMGPEHPSVADRAAGLASLYCELGRYAEAEQLCLRALRIHEQHLQPNHLSMAYPLHWLALIAAKSGKHEEAERLHRQVLRIWEEQLGAEHPTVTRALLGLALLSAQQGRESQAEALFQRALRIREQRTGEKHVETAQVLHDFAAFRQAQGRTQEAAIMYQRALLTREQVLGPDHPLTIETHACMQALLVAQGQREEVLSLDAEHKQEQMAPVKNQMPDARS